MPQCNATTRKGARCRNIISDGNYCTKHARVGVWKALKAGAIGAVGTAVFAPTLPAIAAGAGVFMLGSKLFEGERMTKKVFVSFDFDNDRQLKEFIIGQSKNADSPFEISDHSLKEAKPEKDWEKSAHRMIARSDIVLVMVGPETHRATGVLKEVAMAREIGVPIVQVIGYRNGDYTPVPNAGRLYRWNWQNLKNLLS